jgi:hypothetical protein
MQPARTRDRLTADRRKGDGTNWRSLGRKAHPRRTRATSAAGKRRAVGGAGKGLHASINLVLPAPMRR